MPTSHRDILIRLRAHLAASPDGRLAPERQLAAELGVARSTVRRALEVLATEGHVLRERRLGTRARRPGLPAPARGAVAFLGDPAAHLIKDLVAGLAAALALVDRQLIEINPETLDDATLADRLHGLTALVGAGEPLARGRGLMPKLPAVHAGLWPNQQQEDWVQVSADQLRATWLATNHLIVLGHRRIAFIGGNPDQPGDEPELRQSSPHTQAAQGWRLALGDYSLHGRSLGVAYEDPRSPRRIAAFLTRVRPTAVVCDADFRAREVEQVAATINLRIPADLSLVGIGNTPWTTRGRRLTTIDLEARAIGNLAASCLITQAPPGIWRSSPRLIVGTTTAAPLR